MNIINQIVNIIGYDKDNNEIFKMNNVQLKNFELAHELSKAINSLGITVSEFD